MKKLPILLLAIVSIVLITQCSEQKSDESASPPEDRNMFGLYIPRGLTVSSEDLAPGYVLFSPTNSASVYLMNRKGEIVHEWKSNYAISSPYLNEDGSLTVQVVDPDFPVFAGGGEAGRIQHIRWDSKIMWDFEYANEEHCAHHDIAVLPNGNVLTIAWEARSAEEVLAAGRKPEYTPKAGLWPTQIVEIEPEGKRGGKIVWKWSIWDHIIQDFDSTKVNYGDVAAHPELLDINIEDPVPPEISQDSMDALHKIRYAWRNQTVENRGSDVYHANAINYNAELDQIVFSSPHLDEIFIIDHSTSTEEAAGHSGGRWGRGGDFLFRWGNPANYKKGDSTDQQLFGQHDVRWVQKGFPGEGNLTVYNNNVPLIADSLNYSAIYEIKLEKDSKGKYTTLENGQFSPDGPEWTYVAADTLSFWGSFVSGVHRMQNGNTFINEGPKGRIFEVNTEGEIVWEYLNEYRGNITHTNGDPVAAIPFAYYQFRADFIPADHPAFKSREMVPLDPQPEKFKLPPKEKK